MKVREVLTPLPKPALKRLCRCRDISVVGTKAEIRKRLAYSYRGNLSALVDDLRRQDLLTIASECTESSKFPTNLGALAVSKLREVSLAVFVGRCPAIEASADEETGDSVDDQQQSKGLGGGHFDVMLHATGVGTAADSRAGHVDENSLARVAGDAASATILSAYYVQDVLRTIAGACRGDVKIVLNGLGGQRLKEQAADLKELQEELRKQARSAQIRLAFAEGIFHTKLYVFGTGPDAVAWIGSANATKAALNGRNEEVLVRVTPVPMSVSAYVESAWSRAIPVEHCQETVNSLIAFFRTGRLYYKPYATLQWTMNPFLQLMERLPDSEKRKIAAFHSEFADDEAGIGAFNLNLVFERVDEGQFRELAAQQHRVELRRYAVQTCYGYWVAQPFIGHVESMLDQASVGKRRRLEEIRDWMDTDRNTIVGAYGSYLRDVRRILDEENVHWHRYAQEGLFEDTTAIERRLDSLLAVLGTEHTLARHCRAFTHSEVPEIWEDADASALFMESFFDSLAYALSARRRGGSAKLILKSLAPFLEPVSVEQSHDLAQTIRTALEDALTTEGWYEHNFELPAQNGM